MLCLKFGQPLRHTHTFYSRRKFRRPLKNLWRLSCFYISSQIKIFQIYLSNQMNFFSEKSFVHASSESHAPQNFYRAIVQYNQRMWVEWTDVFSWILHIYAIVLSKSAIHMYITESYIFTAQLVLLIRTQKYMARVSFNIILNIAGLSQIEKAPCTNLFV